MAAEPERDDERLLARVEGGVAWITFNNPARHNAMSRDMWDGTADLLDRFNARDDVRVIVLTGAGERAFVAGADISRFESERGSLEAIRAYEVSVANFHRALDAVVKPTIARINGYCIGGGLAIAVGCDIRYCSDISTFGIPAAKLGIGYKFQGIRGLARLVGPSFTAEIFYTGRQFDAEEARNMGLVNRVVPQGDLDDVVGDLVDRIARNAPLAIRAVKQALIELAKPEAEWDLDAPEAAVAMCRTSEDYEEGRRAFMEKRRPQFQGR